MEGNDANNNLNSNPNAQSATGQNNNTNQPQNAGIDYDKIQEMINTRNSKTEESILKSYFEKQGLSKDEMESAITEFKNNKIQKELEANQNSVAMQNEIATLKAQVLQAQINDLASKCATDMGVELKTIPYLVKMADLTNVKGEDGKLSEEAMKTALNDVLEALPQLKNQAHEDNKGYQKIGSDGNNQNEKIDDVLKEIFS